MEARTGRRKEVAAANHVGPIVDVAAVGGTVTGSHQARVSQLCQVIRDEVLRLPGQFDELTDPAIARSEMSNQLPSESARRATAGSLAPGLQPRGKHIDSV
jgi:hypothetical protein